MTAPAQTRKAAVIGDGAWGTALAMVLLENGFNTTVWGPFEDYIASVRKQKENHKFLPGVPLPAELHWTSRREQAVADAEVVILAVPTRYFADVLAGFHGMMPETADIASVAKGLDRETLCRMTELADRQLGIERVTALSGPSHAEEVSHRIPTAVTIASHDAAAATRLQTAFANTHFRVYTSSDPVGVELGGALKNVVAIAVGISDGMGFGDNTRAALITRGLAEMTRLGVALGASPATFAGLSGMGDLIVTCTSQHSRNRGVGERIGRGEAVDAIMGNMELAVEGVWNCAAAHELAKKHRVDVPITDEVYAIVHEKKDPRKAVTDLIARGTRPE